MCTVMKMKKFLSVCLLLSCLMLSGCEEKYKYYSTNIVGPFDTITTYITYASSEEEFNEQKKLINEKLEYYDKLFDRYTLYEDVNNILTINKAAGKEAVKVEKPIIDLLEVSIQRNKEISDKVNIAFGSVLEIWHQYREDAEYNFGIGDVPTLSVLKSASKHTDINSIVIDKEASTVFIKDKDVIIDVGATAKGYAIELVKDDLIAMGVDNFLLSGGGNVASYGQRKITKQGDFYLDECRDFYCVGIQSPQSGNFDRSEDDPAYLNEALLVVKGQSIVTSGDYQRYYEDVNGIKYHHLIDPDSLYPSVHFRSVSIITEDSGYADFLSSAVFLMDYETGLEFVNNLEGVEAIWLLEDGKVRYSNGLKDGHEFYVIDKDRLN